MTDTTIIWEAMNLIILDSHPIIYQYVKGQTRSKETAVMCITEEVYGIFGGSYDITKVRKIAREFLRYKNGEYKKGGLKIKSIY